MARNENLGSSTVYLSKRQHEVLRRMMIDCEVTSESEMITIALGCYAETVGFSWPDDKMPVGQQRSRKRKVSETSTK